MPQRTVRRLLWNVLNIPMWGLGYKYELRVTTYANFDKSDQVSEWKNDQQDEWNRLSFAVGLAIPVIHVVDFNGILM